MDFLKLPTDNLYKFITIAGLLVFGVSAIYPYFIMKEVNTSSAEMGKIIGLMKLANEEAEREINKEESLIGQATADIGKPKIQQKVKEQLEQATSSGERALARVKEVKRNSIEFDYAATVNNFYMEAFKDAVYWSKRGVIGGLLCTILGFSLWYAKWQRYQDRILKAQAGVGVLDRLEDGHVITTGADKENKPATPDDQQESS